MASWISVPDDCDFSLRNLPYGVFSIKSSHQVEHIGVAIGEYVLDLCVLAQEGLFLNISSFDTSVFESRTLNAFASLSKDVHRSIRRYLTKLLSSETSLGHMLKDNSILRQRALIPQSSVTMHLPMSIGDYTDFFVGIHHAKNCSNIFRKGLPFNKNYSCLPIAYHGRSSSVVISGTPVRRPNGQLFVDGEPTFGPCQKLDFEVEFGAFIGRGNEMGNPIHIDDAEDHIFGFVLLNDWSARDIQMWESNPLGPFNGKNFCTSISSWVVPVEALEPFETGPIPSFPVLPYLQQTKQNSVYDVPINVTLTSGASQYSVSRCNTKNIIFSFSQMIAHHTAGGCPLRTGDLLGTGTLSGTSRAELGCLLETTLNGELSYEMMHVGVTDGNDHSKDTITRTFLEDGDTVEFKAHADDGTGLGRVGFGVCSGKVLPSPT